MWHWVTGRVADWMANPARVELRTYQAALRTAAGLPTGDGDSRVSDTAHRVWQLAEVESAQWRCDVTAPPMAGKVGS